MISESGRRPSTRSVDALVAAVGVDPLAHAPVAALLRRARADPSRPALAVDDTIWTVGELAERSGRLAAGLRAAGVADGDRVAVHLHNRIEAVLTYLACLRIGAIVLPLNTRLTSPELADLVRRTRPVLYIGERELYDRFAAVPAEQIPTDARFLIDVLNSSSETRGWNELISNDGDHDDVMPDLDAPAFLLSTSGTTGRAKIIVWSHRTLAYLYLSAAGRGVADGEILALFTPLMHGAGLYFLFSALAQGTGLVLVRRFDAGAVLDAMQRHRVTALFGLPFMCDALVREQRLRARDVAGLRTATVAGDVCPAAVETAFERTFGVALTSFWAATEDVGATIADERAGPHARLIDQADAQIVDARGRPVPPGRTGELVVRSPTTCLGLWQDDGTVAPLPAGEFRSGDLVREISPRMIQYVGRAKDLIVRAGSNISPTEIEEALRAHPDVVDAGVAGVPDPEFGERVGAVLVLRDTTRRPTAEQVIDWLGRRLADYKLPELIAVLDAVPRNAMTKIDRRAVARAVCANAADE